MKNHSFTYTSIAMLVALAITIAISPTYIGNMKPDYAQSTPDTTSSPTISPDTGSPTGTGASDDGGISSNLWNACLEERLPKKI